MRQKIVKLTLLTIFITIFSSCEEKLCGCTVVDADVNLIVTDSENRNLLDPSTPEHFKEDDIRIYFLRNGQREEAYAANLDAPRYFRIDQSGPNGEYMMRLFPDLETHNSDITTTIIRWNGSDEDTVACEIRNTDNSTIITRVWYNDDLGYDQNDQRLSRYKRGPRLINVRK
ncbi:hypothetical protein WBG78_01085 [Chryseolinea sp. T2]|uniref:hypothetical protein n=1 Tax=Chryseolinea sp. T2 TaxID=3129255 RepID=UPI003076AC8B